MNRTAIPVKEPAERVLILTRTLAAPRELVFKVWTQPEYLSRWWGPKDFTLPFCEQDFRPGGKYKFCMLAPDGFECWVWGEYREIVEPERIVFTWVRPPMDGLPERTNLVTVTFEAFGDKTNLTLHHAIFLTTEDRDGHNGGWSQCLDRLVDYIAHTAS